MTQNNDGSWTLVLDDPILEEIKSRFDQKYRDEFALTKPIEIAAALWGGLSNIEAALRDGRAWKDPSGACSIAVFVFHNYVISIFLIFPRCMITERHNAP